MTIQLHKTYPSKINHPEGLILAVRIIPCGLPKEGPKVATFSAPFAVVFASNVFDNCGEDVAHWDWYFFSDPSDQQLIEEFVKGSNLTPNLWYYLDIFEGE